MSGLSFMFNIVAPKIFVTNNGVPVQDNTGAEVLLGDAQKIEHSHLFDPTLLHQTFQYEQTSDPGAVGADKFWLDKTGVAITHPLRANLSAFWELSDLTDASGSGNTLTNNNGATFVAGKVGNCVNLVSASSQYLSIADNASLSLGINTPFTLATWVNLTSKPGFMGIAGKWTSSGNQRSYLLYWRQTTDRFVFSVSPDGTNLSLVEANSLGSPSLSTWYFLVAWYDGSMINLQVNNGVIDSLPYTGTFDNTGNFQIGAFDGAANFLNGKLDQVTLWKSVLDEQDRVALYNNGNGLALASIPATSTAYQLKVRNDLDNGWLVF